MSVISETVALENGISGPAKDASNELNALERALTNAQDKLTVASALGNVVGYRKAAADVANLKAAISALPPAAAPVADAANNMGKAFESSGAKSQELSSAFAGAADAARFGKEVIGAAAQGIKDAVKSIAAGDVQGALSALTDAIGGIAKSLDLLVPGLGEVAAAAVGAAGGIAGLAVAGMKSAIEANEARAKWQTLFDALGGGGITGKQTLDMLDELGGKIGQTREQLAPLTKEFMAMGIDSAQDLRSLTLAAASAGAMAEGGAQAFTKLYQQADAAAQTGAKFTVPYKKLQTQLVGMGLNIDDLATAMGTTGPKLTAGLKAGTVSAKDFANALQDAATNKGAGPLARAGNSLASVWAKFKETFAKIFESLAPQVDAFLASVKDLFGVFDNSSSSGQTLQKGIGGAMKWVFEQATKLVPLVKHFLLDLVIWGLKAYIGLKPIIGWFLDLKNNQTVMKVLGMAFDALWTVLKGVAVAVGLVVAVFVGLAAVSVAVGASIWALFDAIAGFTADAIKALLDWASQAADAAKNFVQGLIDGITSGAGAIVDAVTNVAAKAKDAFKSALGIHSPSTVMFEMGDNVAAGVELGIQGGTQDVKAASTEMAKAAAAPVGAVGSPAPAVASPKINAPSLNAGVLDVAKATAIAAAPAAEGAIMAPAVAAPALGAPAPAAPAVQALQAPTPQAVSPPVSAAVSPNFPPPAAAPAASPDGGGKSGVTVTVEPGAIQISGAGKGAEEITETMIALLFERVALSQGLG